MQTPLRRAPGRNLELVENMSFVKSEEAFLVSSHLMKVNVIRACFFRFFDFCKMLPRFGATNDRFGDLIFGDNGRALYFDTAPNTTLPLATLEAQQSGTLTGTATDQVGKPIPSASVEVRNESTAASICLAVVSSTRTEPATRSDVT